MIEDVRFEGIGREIAEVKKMLLKQESMVHGAWRSLVPAADLALISLQILTFYFVSKIHFREMIGYSQGFFLHSNLKHLTRSKC